jgi:hypothetical protein
MTLYHLPNDWCVLNETSITSDISKIVASFLFAHTDVSCVPVSREKKDDTLESGKATSRKAEISELLLPVSSQILHYTSICEWYLRQTNHTTPVFVYSWLQKTGVPSSQKAVVICATNL